MVPMAGKSIEVEKLEEEMKVFDGVLRKERGRKHH